MNIPIAANVLGTMGAVCWSIQLIPQIVINYRRHNTTGLQPTMMILWACAGVALGVYNVVKEFNIALRIQPQLLTLLSLITWIQCYYYEKNWTVGRSLGLVVPVACLMGSIQAGLIFGLRHAKREDLQWPSIVMAVTSAALLAAGVLRHYIDIYLYRTVRGISFIFVGIDALGDVFSLASIFFQLELDVLGIVIYSTELFLWLGVFMCGAYFNLLPWIDAHRSSKRHPVAPSSPETARRTDMGVVASGIALHDQPSSTSVFRTPSGNLETTRQHSLHSNASRSNGPRPDGGVARQAT